MVGNYTAKNIHLDFTPVRACPDHSHKAFCNQYYLETPTACNYRVPFSMLMRNFILAWPISTCLLASRSRTQHTDIPDTFF
jgi:hypothetical protein